MGGPISFESVNDNIEKVREQHYPVSGVADRSSCHFFKKVSWIVKHQPMPMDPLKCYH